MEVYSVENIVCEIKERLTGVSCKRVRGVVGKVTKAASGHFYFEVVDEMRNYRIECVSWSSTTSPPTAGLCELLVSRVDFYGVQSRCQLIVNKTFAIANVKTHKA